MPTKEKEGKENANEQYQSKYVAAERAAGWCDRRDAIYAACNWRNATSVANEYADLYEAKHWPDAIYATGKWRNATSAANEYADLYEAKHWPNAIYAAGKWRNAANAASECIAASK